MEDKTRAGGSVAEPGTLYVVATPIGNLEDITLRAIHILESVDTIAAEDTRHTRRLLTHYGISKPLVSYHDHNKRRQAPYLLSLLQEQKSIAIVTDAGTPGISDPAYYLLQAVLPEDIPVVPIPGATAVIAALSVAGLPTDRFVFEGFLPIKSGRRHRRLETLREEPRTIVLYESPHRLIRLLQEIATHIDPDRQVVVGRELTKRFEELLRGTAASLHDQLKPRTIRGECTVLIAGHS